MDPAEMISEYFGRIGYQGARTPSLETLHQIIYHHSTTVPFENLDVLLNRDFQISLEDVFVKIVRQKRGGYCFEQNTLLCFVLTHLGFNVKRLGGRIRWLRAKDEPVPRTHFFMLVEFASEGSYLADVGIGRTTPTSAIKFEIDTIQHTPHEPRRILQQGMKYLTQILLQDWCDVCEFTLDDMPHIDCEMGHWFTKAHPNSHFRNRLIVARASKEGRITLLNDQLTIHNLDGGKTVRTISTAAELLEILHDHFQLAFPPGTRFGVGNVAVQPWPTV